MRRHVRIIVYLSLYLVPSVFVFFNCIARIVFYFKVDFFLAPRHRFVQQPGDIVYVNSGTVHWVQALGWCNNIAWNTGPFDARQFALACERYEWNRTQHFKSIVPMLNLSWALARNVSFRDPLLYQYVKQVLRRSLRSIVQQLRKLEAIDAKQQQRITYQERESGEAPSYCDMCDEEIYALLYCREDRLTSMFVPYCAQCARAQGGEKLEGFVVIQQARVADLGDWYDACQFAG